MGNLLVDECIEFVYHLLLVEELVDRVEGFLQRQVQIGIKIAEPNWILKLYILELWGLLS